MKIQPEEKPLRLLLAALLLAVFPLANWLAGETRSQNPAGRAAAAGVPGQYNGPGSCSSTSCHGSLTPVDGSRILQNEFSTWVAKDKHSKAYRVLTEDLGVQMARILHLEKGAENSPKCLACHALYVADEKKRARTFGQSEQEGVSCESCHGPAAGWLGEHTARDWPHDRSVAAGMYDTRDLIKRAEKCLSCHVGSQEKFVDHGMIRCTACAIWQWGKPCSSSRPCGVLLTARATKQSCGPNIPSCSVLLATTAAPTRRIAGGRNAGIQVGVPATRRGMLLATRCSACWFARRIHRPRNASRPTSRGFRS